MIVDGKQIRPIWLGEDKRIVQVIDQRKLPQQLVIESERGYMYECKDSLWIDSSGFRAKGLIPDIVEQMLRVYNAGPKQDNPIVKKARRWAEEHDWNTVSQKWVQLFDELNTKQMARPSIVSQEV